MPATTIKIKELENYIGKGVSLDNCEVIEVEEARKTRSGVPLQNILIKDDTGTATLTLWTNDVNSFARGDRLRLTNGFASAYQDKIQLSAGKYGKLEKVE